MKARPAIAFVGASLMLGGMFPSLGVAAGGPLVPASCTRARTAKLVRSFVASYNGGDLERLEQLWAREPDFQWYFVDDEREGAEAEDRPTLAAYFAGRARLEDRLRLLRLRVNRNGTDFSFELRRRTDDDRRGAAGRFHGKGSSAEVLVLPTPGEPVPSRGCALTVWSMDADR